MNERVHIVMDYADLMLTADTIPDSNGNMWMHLRNWKGPYDFDLKPREVKKLRDACNEYLASLEVSE